MIDKDKVKARQKKYRENNKEEVKERQRKWREVNREKIKEKNKKYRELNKSNEKYLEVKNEANRRWREANRDVLREQSEQYRRDNVEQIKKYKKQYHKSNKENINNYHKVYRLLNKEKYVEYKVNRYGLTIEAYKILYKQQNDVCAICKQPERKIVQGKMYSLAVDHDHATGKVRGLLCHSCNLSLGGFKENLDYLQSAIDYLKRNKLLCTENPLE